MGRMCVCAIRGPHAAVSFPRAGTYAFTTRAGEDYRPGIETVGPDNRLRLL
jgi:hypothetical protein